MKQIVLVIDDDASIRDVVHVALEFSGYEVVEAIDGRDALEKLSTFSPTLILLDLMMPEMDGLSFAQELRNRHILYPIVAFSASGTARAFAEQINAVGYLEKPFHIPKLLDALSQWINQE